MTQLNLIPLSEYILRQQGLMDVHRVAMMNCESGSNEWYWRRDLYENARCRTIRTMKMEQDDFWSDVEI